MAVEKNLVDLFEEEYRHVDKPNEEVLHSKIVSSLECSENDKIINNTLIKVWLEYCAKNKFFSSFNHLLQYFANKYEDKFALANLSTSVDILLQVGNSYQLIALFKQIKNTNNKFYKLKKALDIIKKHGDKLISEKKQLFDFMVENEFEIFYPALLILYVKLNNINNLKSFIEKYKLDKSHMHEAFNFAAEEYWNSGKYSEFIDYFLAMNVNLKQRWTARLIEPLHLFRTEPIDSVRLYIERGCKLRIPARTRCDDEKRSIKRYFIKIMNLEELTVIASAYFKAFGNHFLILQRFSELNGIMQFKKFINENNINKQNLVLIYEHLLKKYLRSSEKYHPFVNHLFELGVKLTPMQKDSSVPYSLMDKVYKTEDKLILSLINLYKDTKAHINCCIKFSRLDLMQDYGYNEECKGNNMHVIFAIKIILMNSPENIKEIHYSLLEFLLKEGFSAELTGEVWKTEKFLFKNNEGLLVEPKIKKSLLFSAIEQNKARLVEILIANGCKLDDDLIQCLKYIKTSDEIKDLLRNNYDTRSQPGTCKIM